MLLYIPRYLIKYIYNDQEIKIATEYMKSIRAVNDK